MKRQENSIDLTQMFKALRKYMFAYICTWPQGAIWFLFNWRSLIQNDLDSAPPCAVARLQPAGWWATLSYHHPPLLRVFNPYHANRLISFRTSFSVHVASKAIISYLVQGRRQKRSHCEVNSKPDWDSERGTGETGSTDRLILYSQGHDPATS